MFRPIRPTLTLARFALALLTSTAALAQEPPAAKPGNPPDQAVPDLKIKAGPGQEPILEFNIEVKPLPPVAIPDDPPPHEGALIDIPYIIEPPDILVVEILEALPGRPITGERLVRSDGTISLGFYGDINVRGLTLDQAKVKVLLHLRNFMNDQVLGLVTFEPEEADALRAPDVPPDGGRPSSPPEVPNAVPNGGRSPFDLDIKLKTGPDEVTPAGKKPEREAKPSQGAEGRPVVGRPTRGLVPKRPRLRTSAFTPAARPQEPAQKPQPEMIIVEEVIPQAVAGQMVVVPPAESKRAFVDIASYNSKIYYVQGDVGAPGRLPHTGSETVLDALNYAGGLLPSAEPSDIHLYRPARGGKPAKDYKIDIHAIMKGVATANLQMFPGDRLHVGRSPILAKTTEIDRAAGLLNSIFHSNFQYTIAARSLTSMNVPASGGKPGAEPPAITPEQRDASIREWADFLWSISSKEGGRMLDERAFREALLKKLSPK